MKSKSNIPHVCKLILSKKFTVFASILILSCQVSLLAVILLFCIYEHFQRVGDTRCILPFISYKPNAAICFFNGLLPGLVVIPILAGFLMWPLVLITHTLSLLVTKRKYFPPFHAEIQRLQINAAEWLIERENNAKSNAYVEGLLSVGRNNPRQMLPIEIIQMIIKNVEQDQKEEISRIRKHMRRKSKAQNNNSILRINQRNRFFYSHSGYLVFAADSIFLPEDFLHHDTSYYMIFSKDVCIFTFLGILQISLPYWLYSL